MSVPRFPNYTVQRELGRGAFATVYQATSDVNGFPVAIKALGKVNDDALQRFERESRLLAEQVNNPHVVSVYGWDLEHAPPYLVMEFCAGGTLQPWVAERKKKTSVVSALLNAASGLASLHAAGGFHRDIKPPNLLLSVNEKGSPIVKLGDFGVARSPVAGTSLMTDTPWGTDGYRAPELLQGGRPTPAIDIYSLGITGIELLTGRREVDSICSAPVPAALRDILLRMVNTSPRARPDCAVVIETLRTILAELKVKALKTPPSSRKVKSTSPGVVDILAGLLLGALVVGTVAVGAVAVGAALGDGDGDDDPE